MIHGIDSLEYENSASLVKSPHTFRQWKALAPMKSKTLRGPSDDVLAAFKKAAMSTHPRCGNQGCTTDHAANGPDLMRLQRCAPCLEKLNLDVYYCST